MLIIHYLAFITHNCVVCFILDDEQGPTWARDQVTRACWFARDREDSEIFREKKRKGRMDWDTEHLENPRNLRKC